MDSGRVGACHRLENKRRKFLMVVNDVIKNKYDVYAEHLNHTHQEAEYNFEKSKMFVRRALVRQKVLQKCMKMRKRSRDVNPMFGHYGGRPIEAFTRDIEGFIAHNHPKLRRKRYLEKLLDESLETGAILKQTAVSDRVSNWMERSYTKYKLMKAKREKTVLEPIKEKKESLPNRNQNRIPKLPVLSNPFYSGTRAGEDDDIKEGTKPADVKPTERDVLKLADDLNQVDINVEKSQKVQSDTQKERRTLVLPPIKTNKAMVVA